MKYVEVVNWDQFQHYKDRNPPWIKLHSQLLENYDFTCLPDCSKSHLLGIWMLASRTDNKVPANPQWIGNKLGATEPVDLDLLIKRGFLKYNGASTTLADCSNVCTGSVPSEEESRGETEAEKRREETPAKAVFVYWQSVMSKQQSRFTVNRKNKINTRLKNYSEEQIKKAIDGCKRSKFHMGKNDQRTEYNGIEHICRNDEKVEYFMNIGNRASNDDADMSAWIKGESGSPIDENVIDLDREEFHSE